MDGFMTDTSRIKDAIDLSGLIAEYVDLRKYGRDFLGRCPFHEEQTASFVVHPDYFKCFGCGFAGDCFTFLQRIEGIPFREALKRLADRAGISLDGKPVSRAQESLARRDARECADWWGDRKLADVLGVGADDFWAAWPAVAFEPVTDADRYSLWKEKHTPQETENFLRREEDWRMIDSAMKAAIRL